MGRMMQPFGLAFTSPAMTAMFWQRFETAAKATEPFMRSVTQAQLESAGLVANRARAWLEIPQALAKCRTPQDLLIAQSEFWQRAMRDYMETGKRVTASWQTQLADASKAIDATMEIERDRIEFPDPTAPSRPAAETVRREPRPSDEPRRDSDRPGSRQAA